MAEKISDYSYETALSIVQEHQNVESANENRRIERENKKLIGTYWKYSNSYGSGEKWWIYSKIIGVDGATLKKINYQLTTHNKADIIEQDQTSYSGRQGMDRGWTKITYREFTKGTNIVLKKLGVRYR